VARTDWIGLRVARWRDIAGMTQKELADRVGCTRAYIAMIEGGRRAVTKRSLLIKLATALRVSVTDLTEQPRQPATPGEHAIYHAVPEIRGALDDDPRTDEPVDVDALACDVDRAMRARMQCDYETVAALLPGLVADTRRLANDGDDRALPLFVRAATVGALTTKPFGYVDLAVRLAERAALAAERYGRPAERAAAAFTSAQTALASGTTGGRARSLSVASTAAGQLGDDGDDETLSLYGMLHLQAALSAASLGRHDDVSVHLAEAESAATRVAGDPWRLEFGRTNVGIWRVSCALENGEPDRAPEYARQVDRTQVRTANRLSRLHIDTGRGWYAAGQPEPAVRAFLLADDVSPAELRTRPTVREIVGQMVRDARRRGSPELQDLAIRMGIDPLDPDLDLA
jgi:transcriptional regulator with XRE-family HTH domain